MMVISFTAAAVVLAASTHPALGSEPAKYIIVLSTHGELTDAAVSAAGGVVLERAWDHVVAQLTLSAVETLRSDKAVKYFQRLGNAVDQPAAQRASQTEVEDKTAPRLATGYRHQTDWVPSSWDSGAYVYDGSGNITAIGTQATPPSTGGLTNTFTYDTDSRLTGWSATGGDAADLWLRPIRQSDVVRSSGCRDEPSSGEQHQL